MTDSTQQAHAASTPNAAVEAAKRAVIAHLEECGDQYDLRYSASIRELARDLSEVLVPLFAQEHAQSSNQLGIPATKVPNWGIPKWSQDPVVTYMPADALAAMEDDDRQKVPKGYAVKVKALRERFLGRG